MKTCYKCKKLKSNGGRCPGPVHHCVVGNYDLFEPMIEGDEDMICDHASKCKNVSCPERVKHLHSCDCNDDQYSCSEYLGQHITA